jgi:hypothetical protein
MGRGGTDWIHLAQDRDQWGAFVNLYSSPDRMIKSKEDEMGRTCSTHRGAEE